MNQDNVLNIWLKKFFLNTNNIVIRLMSRKRNMQEPSMKYYLASKIEDEIYFYDGLEILFTDGYKYDNNLNLQILNDDGKIVQRIAKEKYFHFEKNYLLNQNDEDFNLFIKLPLSRPINFDEFNKKHNNPLIILEETIKDQAIEDLKNKQEKAIHYDATQAYDNYTKALENQY